MMTPIDRAYRLGLTLGLAAFVCVAPLSAAATCELPGDEPQHEGSGTGGTGVHGDEGSGTGGTGVRGDEGSGTGGTGILGTITGFGSICVNGLRISYDDETPVEREGQPATARDLAVGRVVRVTAQAGERLYAQRIVMESALSGPVTRIERDAGRAWVMDQPVELPPDALVEAFEPGDSVEVSGQRRSDGVVVATRVDRSEPGGSASVVGVAVSISGRTAYVGDLRVQANPGAREFASGDRVALRGKWNRETQTLEASDVSSASVRAPEATRLSLQGFASPGPAGTDFRLAGVAIDASGLAERDRDPSPNRAIRVQGQIDRSGRLRAERIHMDRSQWGLRKDRIGSRSDDDSAGSDRSDREDRADRSGSGRADRTERSERPERTERSERPERPDRSGRSGD